MNSRFHVSFGLALILAASSQAQHRPASPEEIDYIRLVAKYEAMFKGVGNDSVLQLHKAALRDLEPRLRRIVGPFAIPGFVQPGQLNNDDMFDVDEGFDRADGIRYQSSASRGGEESFAVVTTESILRGWLQRREGKEDTAPLDVALARQYMLTWAISSGAAATPYAQIPPDTLRSLGITWGWIGNFEQDDCPCAARHAVFMLERGKQLVIVALPIQHPIDPSAACVAANKPARDGEMNRGEDFRSCYGREVVRDPRFGRIVAQIREMVDRIGRQ